MITSGEKLTRGKNRSFFRRVDLIEKYFDPALKDWPGMVRA
jgi:hypothetical protein